MMETIRVTFKLKGTEKQIQNVRAHIAILSTCEGVESLYIGGKGKNGKENRE